MSKWPDSTAGHYLISVSGLPMMGAGGGRGMRGGGMPPPQQFQVGAPQQQGPPGQMDPQERQRMMQERLKESTRLERKGKDPIAPDQVGSTAARRTRRLWIELWHP